MREAGSDGRVDRRSSVRPEFPGTTGTAVYHDSNASGALEPATDGLSAILIPPVALTAANTLTTATCPAAVTLESIGLTDPPVVTTINDGTGVRLQFQFTINEPLPAGTLLEIQTTSDFVVSDPWQTIAGKNGTAAGTGIAPVTAGTPENGQVTITVSSLRPAAGASRLFLRVRVLAP